ncbi:hypothetical protein BG003_010112 [Podila horticola]|nr:hypothetical protein BG003_010112 [Podila horticola]
MEALEIGDDAEKDTFVLAQRKLKRTVTKVLPGAPLSNETGLSILHKASVKVRLAVLEGKEAHQLSWIIGWARSDLGLPEEAVGLVSRNLADIFVCPMRPRFWL